MGRGALLLLRPSLSLVGLGWVVRFLMNLLAGGVAVAGRDQLDRLDPVSPDRPQILGILRASCGNHTQ